MMLRWFSILMLCCVALPWLNTLHVAVNVAQVKAMNRRAALSRLHNDCDTLFVDVARVNEIRSAGELRIGHEAYDVVSSDVVNGKLRVVAFKDNDETELERVATKSTNQRDKLKSVAYSICLFFENRTLLAPKVAHMDLTLTGFKSLRCNTSEHTRLHAPPPKVA